MSKETTENDGMKRHFNFINEVRIMEQIKYKRMCYMITVVAGVLLFQVDIAAGQGTIEQSTQNTPLSSTAEALPSPSNAVIEYMDADQTQSVENAVPDWDIAGELRDFDFVYTSRGIARRRKVFNGFKFQLAFMNKGEMSGTKDIPVKVMVLNSANDVLITEKDQVIKSQEVRSGFWGQETSIYMNFALSEKTASDLSDVKLTIEVDPYNTLGEDQDYRGNNIISVHW